VVIDGVDEFASPDEVDARWATLRSLVSDGAVVVAGTSLATSAPDDASVVPLAQSQAQEASL
jgi:hypothetical protein